MSGFGSWIGADGEEGCFCMLASNGLDFNMITLLSTQSFMSIYTWVNQYQSSRYVPSESALRDPNSPRHISHWTIYRTSSTHVSSIYVLRSTTGLRAV